MSLNFMTYSWLKKYVEEQTTPLGEITNGGSWSSEQYYKKGAIVTANDKIYIAIQEVPSGIEIINDDYWSLLLNNIEQLSNKIQEIAADNANETTYPSTKAVYDLSQNIKQDISNLNQNIQQDITNIQTDISNLNQNIQQDITNLNQNIQKDINTKTKLFHASLDPVTTQYIKDSGDFTYADVTATENCKIEATFGNVTIIFNKEILRNIEPDPIAGRYVEFSAILRNGPTTVRVFLFVYDPENLPTDSNSVEILKNWGDSQYCGISVQHIIIGDLLDNDIATGRNNTINAPSTKATGDYVDSQCGTVLEYMQTTFAQNIMNLVNHTYGPHIIYNDPVGFEASNDNAGDTWHLTGLNLSQYKRIKCYVCAGGDDDANYSPEHIVEVHLDDRAKGSFGYFSASHTGHNPNNRNRYHIATFTVNAEKTAIQFQHSISIYGTSASNSVGGRRCYLIEGYLV